MDGVPPEYQNFIAGLQVSEAEIAFRIVQPREAPEGVEAGIKRPLEIAVRTNDGRMPTSPTALVANVDYVLVGCDEMSDRVFAERLSAPRGDKLPVLVHSLTPANWRKVAHFKRAVPHGRVAELEAQQHPGEKVVRPSSQYL